MRVYVCTYIPFENVCNLWLEFYFSFCVFQLRRYSSTCCCSRSLLSLLVFSRQKTLPTLLFYYYLYIIYISIYVINTYMRIECVYLLLDIYMCLLPHHVTKSTRRELRHEIWHAVDISSMIYIYTCDKINKQINE